MITTKSVSGSITVRTKFDKEHKWIGVIIQYINQWGTFSEVDLDANAVRWLIYWLRYDGISIEQLTYDKDIIEKLKLLEKPNANYEEILK